MTTQTQTHDEERWLPIPGFEGYEVSDQGRVRSTLRRKPHILHPGGSRGYWMVGLRRDGQDHPRSIHRLVALTFLGPCPEGMEVCHGDGNPHNNTPQNLRYDTREANADDVTLLRLNVTRDQVREIREAMAQGGHFLAPEMAQQLGISEHTLWRIAGGHALASCPGPIKTATTHAEERAARVRQAYREGCSLAITAALHGLTYSGVSRLVNRNRLPDAPDSIEDGPRQDDVAKYPWWLRMSLEDLNARQFGEASGHFVGTCPICGGTLGLRVAHWQKVYVTCDNDCSVASILAEAGLPQDAARADPMEEDEYWDRVRTLAGRVALLRGA